MSLDLAYALRGYEISNTAKVIYGVLEGLSRASASKGLPYTYIGQKAIAERVGVCERTAHTAIKQLVSVGLIMVKRRGLCRTNAMYVLSPKATKQEKDNIKAICGSGTAKNAFSNITSKSVNKTIDDKPSIPVNENSAASPQDKAFTAPKGRPTNKRPRINVDERQKMKQKYKEYLYKRLDVNNFLDALMSNADEHEALIKIVELISNTMASKGQIMVNGCLLTKEQWWYVVKNISQCMVIELIYKLRKAKDVKNMRAYMLASLYNAAMIETIEKPWYSAADY